MYAQVEKSKVNKNRAVANSIAQQKSSVKQAFGFVGNRLESVAQQKQQEMTNNIHLTKNIVTPRVLQAKRISINQMESLGFTGPHQGGSWQYNDSQTGCHVTVVRQNGYANHLHVRRDTVGGVYNRIDYNEIDNVWVEKNVNVPAGQQVEADLRNLAEETIELITALVPPKN